MRTRYWLFAALGVAAPAAMPCTFTLPNYLYTNVVRLDGPRIEGLEWLRIYNILSYEGTERVLVSAVREGQRIPVAKWEQGQECFFDKAGAERCAPNEAYFGINLQGYFGSWSEASNRRSDLKKLDLRLVVEIGDREIAMSLRSRPVRTNRELRSEYHDKIASLSCPE